MKKLLLACTATGAALLAAVPSPALASCSPGISNPVQHALGGYFEACADANPVAGFVYSLGAAGTINSANIDVICEDGAALNGQLSACQPDAGAPGDGIVTLSFDYGNPGIFPGCPNPGLAAVAPRQVVQVVANDGASLLVSTGWSPDLGQYGIDFAQGETFPPAPLRCSHSDAGLSIISFDGTNLRARIPAPKVYTDCDPGTWGATGGGVFAPICDPTTVPETAPGRAYQRTGRCGTSPDPRLSGWTLAGTADETGEVMVAVNRPTTEGDCAFVGVSGTIGGAETLATVGSLQIAGQNPPAPRALEVRARRAGGDVVVSWRTAAELGLVGFDVTTLAQGGKNRIKVNDTLIAAKGGPTGAGATYEVAIPMGNFKGGKSVVVRSVLSTGGELLSDPASF